MLTEGMLQQSFFEKIYTGTIDTLAELKSTLFKYKKRRLAFYNARLVEYIVRGDILLAERILERKANPNTRVESGETVLHTAAGIGNLDAVQLLLNAKAYMYSIIDKDLTATPLSCAIANRHVKVLEVFFAYGYDANHKRCSNQIRPLEEACYFGREEVVELLLEKKASVNLSPNAIFKSLTFPKTLSILISAGASVLVRKKPEDQSNDYGTPLHYAAAESDSGVVESLIGAKANIEAIDIHGFKPRDILQRRIDVYWHENLLDYQRIDIAKMCSLLRLKQFFCMIFLLNIIL